MGNGKKGAEKEGLSENQAGCWHVRERYARWKDGEKLGEWSSSSRKEKEVAKEKNS